MMPKTNKDMVTNSMYDVVICGGGLAGLCLARQLKLTMPELSVLVLEKASGEVPVSDYKVGESFDETSNYYLSEILGLKDYIRNNHMHKLGLRWFFGDGRQPFETRPEVGPPDFPGVRACHVERRILDNHIRELNEENGISILKGVLVKDIQLSEDDSPHEVLYSQHGTDNLRVKCRWVIDAMGRRRFLQSKLNLTKPSNHDANAVWWQLEGKYNVDDMGSDPAWKSRNKHERWLSTNHLMGNGYWVWIIPLVTGNTSIGIVAAEDIHPLRERKNFESAMKWLRKHEPHFAKFIENANPLNFLAVKDFCYDSQQIFSEQRWACVGDAGIFTDPFLSPGVVMLAYTNCLTTKMIELDRKGQLTKKVVEQFNNLVLNDIGHNYLELYRDNYPVFRSFEVMSLKFIWDGAFIWYFAGSLLFRNYLTDPEVLPRYSTLAQRFLGVNKRMQRLFRDLAKLIKPSDRPLFLPYDISKVPSHLGYTFGQGDRFYPDFFKEAYFGLITKKNKQQYLDDLEKQVEEYEVWAQVIFRHILNQVMPEQLSKFPEPFWVNAWAISLDPHKWQEDGLFEPKTEPKNLQNFFLADLSGEEVTNKPSVGTTANSPEYAASIY